MANIQSFLRGELRQNVLSTDAVPFDLKVSVVPDLDNQYITVDPDTDSEEIFYFTTRTGTAGGPGTVHVTARGYKSYDATTDTDLRFGHSVNAAFKGSANHILLNDKISGSDGGTIADTKALGFGAAAYIKTTDNGTNLKFKDGSNSEKTLSDILTLTGNDGKVLNSSGDTTRGFLSDKLAVSGSGLSKTTTNPGANESATVSLVIASTAEARAGTDDAKVMTAAKVKDSIDYQVVAASTTIAGRVELATEAEAFSGASSVVLDAATAKSVWGYDISAGSTNTAADSTGFKSTTSTSYQKIKEIACNLSGSYQVSFHADGSGSSDHYYRIYKNGVAFGTERGPVVSDTSYAENLAFSSGDLIQLYAKTSNATYSAGSASLAVKYDLTPNVKAVISSKFTVNL